MTREELKQTVEELRQYKNMKEELENQIKALEHEVTSYMETENTTEVIGDNYKVTYKEQIRKTLDKVKLETDLGDLSEYEKVTSYNVLRIK
ncbi:hypothetical protein [Anaerotignum sp.]|uniref:hypothetical protein n=1 Tax=Anaerotignum sp. TaxID=2039241 RepID=UPI0028A19211|nr:hypothetical protein [Anaerotignum sp.]